MQRLEAVYDEPAIMIVDDKIHSFEQLDHVLRWVAKEKTPLILMVREIEDTVLAWLVANKLQKGMRIAVIKTPGFNSSEFIEDTAHRVGARSFNPDWHPLNSFEPSDLGGAKRVIVGRIDSTIIEGRGDISGRLSELNAQAENESDTTKQKFIHDRINRLSGSVATICVHADSDTEMRDLKLRIEDAINASRAALSEGVVAGGGTALLRCIIAQPETIGEKILAKSFEQPFRNILLNADENPDAYINQVIGSEGMMGFDAYSKKLVSMWDSGILDPTKVTRTAVIKAGSVASMLLTTGHAIITEEEKK
jgi:chaperonin GroEL